jgi:hypothetical protein
VPTSAPMNFRRHMLAPAQLTTGLHKRGKGSKLGFQLHVRSGSIASFWRSATSGTPRLADILGDGRHIS